MLLLIALFFFLFTSCEFSAVAQSKKSHSAVISQDTIQYLKRKSETLLAEEKYLEVYQAF
jgi:hypothetical protein